MEWITRAACKDVDPNFFFPVEQCGQKPEKFKYCISCPVQLECLQAAMEAEGSVCYKLRFGIWGGTTPRQREGMYRDGISARSVVTGSP